MNHIRKINFIRFIMGAVMFATRVYPYIVKVFSDLLLNEYVFVS